MTHETRLIDPKKCVTFIPCHDGRIEVGCAGGLMQATGAGLIRTPGFISGNSDIGAVRTIIGNHFYKSDFDWLICIDSDIQFTLDDLRLLMSVTAPGGAEGPTRNEAGEEVAVTCEYAKKDDQGTPVRFGMGFVRLHKSVFQALEDMADRVTGEPMLGRFYEGGGLKTEYFPTGVTADSRRLGEDTYFWTLIKLCGIVPRIETRTRLIHWGKKGYAYLPQAYGGA